MLVSLNYLCVDHKLRHPPKKRSFHKNRREEAQNSFESYLYKLRDLLNDSDRRDIWMRASSGYLIEVIWDEPSQFLSRRIALEWVIFFVNKDSEIY